MYGQYVPSDVAITKLQAEVVKYEALVNNPPANPGVLQKASTAAPPSMYVMIMNDMIVKITETKKVETAIAAWEQIMTQQSSTRRDNIKKVVDHVKTLLK
jgi:hypothetical protein